MLYITHSVTARITDVKSILSENPTRGIGKFVYARLYMTKMYVGAFNDKSE